MLDKTKIPAFSASVVEDYSLKTNPDSSFDTAFLALQLCISRMLCSNRVKIINELDEIATFPNLYCLTMGRSGIGKDRVSGQFDDLIPFFEEDLKEKEKNYREKRAYELEKEAREESVASAKLKTYIRENMPRSMYALFKSNATPEAVGAVHSVMNEARFGTILWIDTEISGTIARYRTGSPLDWLIDIFKEAYDNGKVNPKITKGEKNVNTVGKIPYVAWLHGAIDIKDGQALFDKFFSLGFARRLFVCMEDGIEPKHENDEELQERLKMAQNEKPFIASVLHDIYKATAVRVDFDNEGSKEIRLSGEALKLYLRFKKQCAIDCYRLASNVPDKIKSELSGRAWRALKMAAIFSVQESYDFLISLKSMEQAIYVTEYFGEQFRRFINLRGEATLPELMIDSLRNSSGMKRTDFYYQHYFPKFKSGQPKIFSENFEIVKDILAETGEIIIEERPNKRTFLYKIIHKPEHESSMNENKIIRLSVGTSIGLTETSFSALEIPFSSLHEVTGGDKAYSAAVFNSDYRSGKNWTGQQDLLILDIDNTCSEPLSIQEAASRFIGLTHMICSTKSHGIEKHGVIANRYRIILPLVAVSKITIEQFKEIVKRVADQYGLLPALDLPASSDVSRMYQPYAGQTFQYNYGLTMNPLAFLYSSDVGEMRRPLQPTQTFKVRGKVVGVDEAIKMAQGKNGTMPCNAFCHDDRTPSAFFCINRDGNFQYTCSVCGISQFKKLK